MWILFFAGLILLREFFSLVFLTFIIGFLMRNVARLVMSVTRAPYWLAVVGPYLVALACLVILMVTAVPRLVDEGAKFSQGVPKLFENLAEEVEKAAHRYGVESFLNKYVVTELRDSSGDRDNEANATGTAETPPVATQPAQKILAAKMQRMLLGFVPGMSSDQSPEEMGDVFRKFVLGVVGGTLNFLLAILLSFLIVLDYDKISRELQKWRESPPGRFFHEAAASVIDFSGTVGTAFQCQMVVALLNASITAVGLTILDIQPIVLLITIVFLLGLIPVLGVFISSVPIILIAFNSHGINHALTALAMIVVVHLLEAYVFNPRIYAARFHLNPVIVLIILLVSEKIFGVWGMLLGIPVTHYVLNLAQVPSQPRKGRNRRKPPLVDTQSSLPTP